MNGYFIGGLEPSDVGEILEVDKVKYRVSDKFKSLLRDSFIDWGTFLEVYHDSVTYTDMFDQVTKLLNIKENENLRGIMLPIIKKIYHLPAEAHMACMLKQFMIYEPVSIAIYGLFTLLKHHFEDIVEQFVKSRNAYLLSNSLHKIKPNDWDELVRDWNDLNTHYNLESSSVILLFLNPPKHIKSGLHFKIPGKEAVIDKLRTSINNFHYPGFCPKVPNERLTKLLKFPINEFITAIRAINPDAKFANYKKIENNIVPMLQDKPKKPMIKDTFVREKPPADLLKSIKNSDDDAAQNARLHLIQWYVTKILELRKMLLEYGKAYEDYYIASARIINSIKEMIEAELH